MPAEEIPSPEGRQQQSDSAQQCDERKHAPNQRICCWPICYQRLRWPVISVGICVPWPPRRGRPCRPGKKSCELADLFWIADGVRTQAVTRTGLAEIFGI